MERDDEVRLAKRLEFMRRRLQAAIVAAGATMQTARRILEDSRIRPLLEGRRGGLGRFLPDGAASIPVVRACREYDDVRREFIERNLHLVVAAAAAYRTYGVPLLDLIQEGNAGLIRAVEKFDWRKSVRFRTYATFWIRQAVERNISANKGMVRVPNYLQQKMRRLRREGRLPRRDEEVSLIHVAREFEVSPEVANRLLQTDRATRSLDVAIGGENDESFAATLAGEEEQAFLAAWEYPLLRSRVTEALAALSDHERVILEYRYGIGRDDPMTLEEVGRLMNVSRERVRQLQVRALRKLQAPNVIARLACFV
jgi:RNA polymerase sigma factor (sigma-70 family)